MNNDLTVNIICIISVTINILYLQLFKQSSINSYVNFLVNVLQAVCILVTMYCTFNMFGY